MNSDLSDIASALTGSLPRDGQAGMTGQLKVPDGSTIQPAFGFTNETSSGLIRAGTGEIGVVIQGTQIGMFDSTGWDGPTTSGAPVGMLADFAGPTAPTFWYLCFGQAVSRTTYVKLFNVIGTAYGSGDGATTFNLPDLRGRVTAGLDNMGGTAANRITTAFFAAPTTLGGAGGIQDIALSAGNIPTIVGINTNAPSYSLANGTTSTVAIVTGTSSTGGGAFSLGDAQNTTASVSGTITIGGSTIAFQSTNTGGGAAFSNLQPTMVVNKIIFAGA